MCVFFLALAAQPSSRYVLVAANNRDEYFARETAQAAFWDDEPCILAGRDLEGRGTWIGVTTDGKFATLTNIRMPYQQPKKSGAKSRGMLVSEFLASGCHQSPGDYCQSVLSDAHLYSDFNLITARIEPEVEATYCTNGDPVAAHSLSPGVYGLSNARLDSPWKKVTRGKSRFSECVSRLQSGIVDRPECERQLLDLLSDQTCLHPDENVPSLGFPESVLAHLNSVSVSPTSLASGLYGTRTNTVVMVSASGKVTYTERTRAWPVDLAHPQWDTNRFTFRFTYHFVSSRMRRSSSGRRGAPLRYAHARTHDRAKLRDGELYGHFQRSRLLRAEICGRQRSKGQLHSCTAPRSSASLRKKTKTRR